MAGFDIDDSGSINYDLSDVSDSIRELIFRKNGSAEPVGNSSTTAKINNHHVRDDSIEVPCYDIVPPQNPVAMQLLKCCVAKRLHEECSKALLGPWVDPDNVEITQIGGGLSNYLFCAYLKPSVIEPLGEQTHAYPHKVLIRIYGEVLRSNADWVILESIIFALLSEKKIGPSLHSLFPGGRIEQYMDSRPLRTHELRLPAVSRCVARKLGHLHHLRMPLVKKPDYLLKTLGRFLDQLTQEPDKLPRRPTSWSSIQDLATASSAAKNGDLGEKANNGNHHTDNHHKDIPVKRDLRSQMPEPCGDEVADANSSDSQQCNAMKTDCRRRREKAAAVRTRSISQIVPNPLLARCEKCSLEEANNNSCAEQSGSNSSGEKSPDSALVDINNSCCATGSLEEDQEYLRIRVSNLLRSYQVVNEFAWIKRQLTEVHVDRFPVVFCHNDLQENNILVVPDSKQPGKIQLLPIDFEYCSYNFRGFDIGNHFNEWCHEYSPDHKGNGFRTEMNNYPTRQQQLFFIYHYLEAFYSWRGGNAEEDVLCYEPSDQDQFELQNSVRIPSDLGRIHLLQNEEKDLDKLRDLRRRLNEQHPLSQWECSDENLLLEAFYGALASHLFWGVWSLIQALISSIQFNFLDYAEVRLRMYHRLKQQLDKMEAHLIPASVASTNEKKETCSVHPHRED